MARQAAVDTAPRCGPYREGRFVRWLLVGCLMVFLTSCRNFSMPSGSNMPTLLVGDIVMALPFGHGPEAGVPARGDMAVFRLPRDGSTYFVKRVIGLPGDRIQMRQGRLLINGAMVQREQDGTYQVKDPYGRDVRVPKYIETLPNGVKHQVIEISGDQGYYDNTDEYAVPTGSYFVMGDNRDNSDDSRDLALVGYIPSANFVAKPWRVLFSTAGDHLRLLKIVK